RTADHCTDHRSIRMRRCVVGIIAALVVTIGALKAEPLATAGVGLASCQKLASDIKPELGFNHLPNALIYYWVQGYMTAANIATLEGDSNYIDLSLYTETVILPGLQEYCAKNPEQKPISYIDNILNTGKRIKGPWKKGTIPWAAD